MRVIAFDIETVPDYMGVNLKDYLYLKSRGRRERTEEEVERDISFNPFTSYVISVAMVTVEGDAITGGEVFYASDTGGAEERVGFRTGDGSEFEVEFLPVRREAVEDRLFDIEDEILSRFWERLSYPVDRIVTFNGYDYDCHVIKVRSMIHGIRPTSSLLDSEPKEERHVDLLRVLSGHDRSKRFSLDFICRKFGIYTPKDRIDGSKVAEEFFKGNYRTIAEYNLKDTVALAQLYLRIKDFLKPPSRNPASESQLRKIAAILKDISGINFDEAFSIARDRITNSEEAGRVIDLLEDVRKRLTPQR